MKSFFRTKQLLSLFICLVIVSSLAIVKHGELLGHSFRSEQKPQAANNDTLRILGNGTAVINTSALASDITGYGGKVPLNIVIKNGVVENIVALKNDETKEFFDNASTLFEKWKGRTIDEAMNMKVDAVTGATFSSKAIIGNMQRGLLYAKNNLQTDESGKGNSSWVSSDNSGSSLFSLRNITGICVVLMAAILPFFCQEQKVSFLSTDTECHCAGILVRNLPFLFFPTGFRSPWHGDIGQHHCDSHADNGLHLSALWQEVALLHPRMSIRLPAADSRQRDEIQDKNESLGNQAA